MCAAILEPNSRVEARGSPEQMKTEGKTPEWCLPRHLVSLLKILITQDGIGGFDHRTCLQRYFRGRGWVTCENRLFATHAPKRRELMPRWAIFVSLRLPRMGSTFPAGRYAEPHCYDASPC
jgi:hypothetical protein